MINEDLYTKEIWKAYHERFNPEEEYLDKEKEINKLDPLVSVCVPTYNHQDFIKECLDSILAQETDFVFEILIGEDESPDNTRPIVKEYAENHPDKIRLFLRDRETSHFRDEKGETVYYFNHKWLRKSARGKYIALCDGDDFWIDTRKLKKQVNFLESNPEFSLCFHNANMIFSSKNHSMKFPNIEEGECTGVEIYRKWIIPTSSAMFRVECVQNFRHAFNKNFIFGDIILFITLAERGRIWCMDGVMGVYRRHEGGKSSKGFFDPRQIRKFIVHHKEISKIFPDKYRKPGHKHLSWIYFLLFKNTYKTNLRESLNSLFRSIYFSQQKSAEMVFKLISTRLKRKLDMLKKD